MQGLVVHDHDAGYGIPVGAMCAEAARVRPRRPFPARLGPRRGADQQRIGGAQGGALRWRRRLGRGRTLAGSPRHRPPLWLLGSEGVAEPWLARELSPSAAARTRFFLARRAPFGFYGFEAMALTLETDRGQRSRSHRDRRRRALGGDRDSILGRYSLDEHGHTTCTAYGR